MRILRNRRQRNIAIQAATLAAFIAVVAFALNNAFINLEKSGITSGLSFLGQRAGFDVNFSLIDYSPQTATHAYAWLAGTLNTVFFAAIAIFTTTILALALAVARLSPNILLANLTKSFVEFIRNVPILVNIFAWYSFFLILPPARQAIDLPAGAFLTNRGLVLPALDWQYGSMHTLALALLVVAAGISVRRFAARRQKVYRITAPFIGVAFVFLTFGYLFGPAAILDVPNLQGFGFKGGAVIPIELLTMWCAVTVYFAAHSSEVIRGALLAVPRGQAEAARALGARQTQIMLEIVAPQALRAIVPPMTSNYINILKAAALGTTIGFLDVMGTTGGSTLNITGQAVECILIVMLTYMALNLILSSIMARINSLVQLKGR